jgi:hypothetical protein
VVALVCHHKVVENAARVARQERIALSARGQVKDVGGQQGLERKGEMCHVSSRPKDHLAHVANVEDRGSLPRVQMLRHHTRGKLNWHLPPGERHHSGTLCKVQIV